MSSWATRQRAPRLPVWSSQVWNQRPGTSSVCAPARLLDTVPTPPNMNTKLLETVSITETIYSVCFWGMCVYVLLLMTVFSLQKWHDKENPPKHVAVPNPCRTTRIKLGLWSGFNFSLLDEADEKGQPSIFSLVFYEQSSSSPLVKTS